MSLDRNFIPSPYTNGVFSSGFIVDRDSERWGLPPKMVHRRRIVFWDLFVADAFQVSF